MKALRMDRKSRYTRMVLQDSLMELMGQKPISRITIKELCEKADINRTTFYAHYASQYDLLRQIEDETLAWAEEVIGAILEKTDKSEAMRILEGILQHIADNRKHIQVLMSEQGDIDFQKQLLTLIYRQCGMDPTATRGEDRDDRELYFVFAVNGSVGLIQHWLKSGLNKPVKEIAGTICDMAFQLQTGQGEKRV